MTVTGTHRATRAALALVLAVGMMTAASTHADAHSGCIQKPQGGAFQAVASAVNVFASVFQTAGEGCVEKFESVQPVMQRDYEGRDRDAATVAGAGATSAACVDGMAASTFPCDGVDMVAHVTMAELGSTFVNDMWGWTDPATGKDYALVGGREGTFFVDVSQPTAPQVMGRLPTASTQGGSAWRDIKVYEDHAFVVSEHDHHGVQVFDLTRLRDWDGTYTTWDEDAHYDGVGRVHNIAINTDTGFAYAVGSNAGQTRADIDCGTGLHMIDVRDPLDPTYAGCFQDHGYVHDTNCVVYDGEDEDYEGRELCFNSAPSGAESVSIVDVTDKANPVAIGDTEYAETGYAHQGWLSPDQDVFFHGDELDEYFGNVETTTTRVWDLSDLDAPVLAQTFANDTTSIDHNMYTEGDLMYQSNYTTGLRVMDIDDADEDGLEEVGFFDVYPENDNATFEGGTWSNYPYFARKGLVGVSSIDRGLFLLAPHDADFELDDEDDDEDEDRDDD